jgi:hypothetical protein
VNKDSGGNVTGSTTYYPAAGALRVNGRLYYALRDQLNSASEVLDASGAIVGEQRYYPFGERRVATGSMFTDRLYTGQRAISGLGLDYYNARYYDPILIPALKILRCNLNMIPPNNCYYFAQAFFNNGFPPS